MWTREQMRNNTPFYAIVCKKAFINYLLTIHYGPDIIPYAGAKAMNKTKTLLMVIRAMKKKKIEQIRFRTRPSNHCFAMC